MAEIESQSIVEEYLSFLNDKAFPCIGAKAALAKGQIKCMIAGHMACPADDQSILQFLYDFIDDYRAAVSHRGTNDRQPSQAGTNDRQDLFHSAAILFRGPQITDEKTFDVLLWQRLQALADLDAKRHVFDHRVSADPSDPDFSFSLKAEAFFIVGLHPASSRPARRFTHPVLAFNPHAQFERLRQTDHYESMKNAVRKRDILFSGSVNPMLDDFGHSSEVAQYSGRQYDSDWQCPLKIDHAQPNHNTTA